MMSEYQIKDRLRGLEFEKAQYEAGAIKHAMSKKYRDLLIRIGEIKEILMI